MGGELGVESELGQRQHLLVHAAAADAQPPSQRASGRSAVGLAGLRALIVDDNDTNRFILRSSSRAWGMHPDVAPRRQLGPGPAREAAVPRPRTTLALLDLSMPDMDGLELAGRISRRPTLAGVELLLLTSVPAT